MISPCDWPMVSYWSGKLISHKNSHHACLRTISLLLVLCAHTGNKPENGLIAMWRSISIVPKRFVNGEIQKGCGNELKKEKSPTSQELTLPFTPIPSPLFPSFLATPGLCNCTTHAAPHDLPMPPRQLSPNALQNDLPLMSFARNRTYD